MRPLRVLSLFDGISCGRVALDRAGIPVERYVACEIDEDAVTVSQKNYPDIEQHGDVFGVDFTQYKGFDLLIGGSPCTYWSIARKNRETVSEGMGFDLFKQYIRAWEESGCPYFLYENNYSIHENIKQEISKYLGVHEIVIDSAYVSAQCRKRCYWTNIPDVQKPPLGATVLEDILEETSEEEIAYWRQRITDLHPVTQQETVPIGLMFMCETPILMGYYGTKSQGQRIYSARGKAITLSANGGGVGGSTGLYEIELPDGSTVVRTLSPVEAERCQTLPDNYTEGVAKRSRYRQIGNGWTVDVIAHILGYLKGVEGLG